MPKVHVVYNSEVLNLLHKNVNGKVTNPFSLKLHKNSLNERKI